MLWLKCYQFLFCVCYTGVEKSTRTDRKHNKGQTTKGEWCRCCSYGNRCISH